MPILLSMAEHFRTDVPPPIGFPFDHGFEMTLSQSSVPKKWKLYGRTSFAFGQFRNSHEYAPGVKWYKLRNHRVRLVAEGLRIVKFPVSSAITPYNSGFTGGSPLLQWMFNFYIQGIPHGTCRVRPAAQTERSSVENIESSQSDSSRSRIAANAPCLRAFHTRSRTRTDRSARPPVCKMTIGSNFRLSMTLPSRSSGTSPMV